MRTRQSTHVTRVPRKTKTEENDTRDTRTTTTTCGTGPTGGRTVFSSGAARQSVSGRDFDRSRTAVPTARAALPADGMTTSRDRGFLYFILFFSSLL